MDWRSLLLDGPAAVAVALWRGYWLLIAGLSIVCLVSALLWLALGLAGYPLP